VGEKTSGTDSLVDEDENGRKDECPLKNKTDTYVLNPVEDRDP
jgi:hypothetical protein